MTEAAREHFDRLLEDVLEGLPRQVRALIDEVPLVVLDRPTPAMIADLKREGTLEAEADGLDLCGLHTGTSLVDRSVESEGGRLPDQIHIFREGIVGLALGEDAEAWERDCAGARLAGGGSGGVDGDEEVYEEIRITVLHELGHHFGLDEGDLDELGYG